MKYLKIYKKEEDYEKVVDANGPGETIHCVSLEEDTKDVNYDISIIGTATTNKPFNLYLNGTNKDDYKNGKIEVVPDENGNFALTLDKKLASAYRMFGGDGKDDGDANNVKTVVNITGTGKMISMFGMFGDSKSLRNVNVSNFNLSKCTNLSRMFSGCENLEEINIENWDLTKLEDCSFFAGGCSKLKTIKLPNTLKKIDKYFLFRCLSLEKITLPNRLEYIGHNALSRTDISRIEFPKTIKELSDSCAIVNSNIEKLDIIIHTQIPPTIIDNDKKNSDNWPFGIISNLSNFSIEKVTIYVPQEAVETYKSTNVWKDYKILPIQQ